MIPARALPVKARKEKLIDHLLPLRYLARALSFLGRRPDAPAAPEATMLDSGRPPRVGFQAI
jgi:hypothetical protein